MNEKAFKLVKILVPVTSIGLTLATNYLSKKELDEKIAKNVSKAIAKTVNEES